jgi:two-component system chemotaxis sensor kinase CheA
MPIYRVTVKFDKDSLLNTVGGIQIYAVLKNSGTVLKTIPDFEQLYEDNFFPTVDYYVATKSGPAEIKKSVILPDVSLDADVADISGMGSAPAPAPAPAAKPAAPSAPTASAAPPAGAPAAGAAPGPKSAGA